MFQLLSKQQVIQSRLSNINFLGLQAFSTALSDQTICQAFERAIQNNRSFINNKIFIHIAIGCNCLYSIFLAKAGAKKVYCVVNGHGVVEKKNVYMMRQIVQENGFSQIIQVMFYRDFSHEVDGIVAEPMGYNLYYDGMLDRMIQIKELYLKDKNKGLILPQKIRYKCAFIHDERFIQKKVDFWNQVHGVPMHSMKTWISHQPIIRTITPSQIVSQVSKFVQFDIISTPYEQIDNLHRKFVIKTPVSHLANGISCWFQLQFQQQDGQKIQIKTSPWSEPTRWAHMTLYSNQQWQLEANSFREVTISGKKNHHEGSTVIRVKVDRQNQQIYRFA